MYAILSDSNLLSCFWYQLFQPGILEIYELILEDVKLSNLLWFSIAVLILLISYSLLSEVAVIVSRYAKSFTSDEVCSSS